MMSGRVTADREAIVRLSVYGPADVAEIGAIIDTGYNGRLTLPPALIRELDLTWRRRGSAILADGTGVEFDAYDASIKWDGEVRPVLVDAAGSDPLLGMALLEGYELTIQAIADGDVTITALG